MKKANFHTHTIRCQHAEGADEDYVKAALEANFDVLGFADHAPWPFQSGYVSSIRMPETELGDYIATIHSLREKYAGQIDLRLGLESEYFPRYHDHLLRMREMGIEYYILGQHYADSEEDHPYVGQECRADEGVLRYAESAVRAMKTGLFGYLAHPDLFMRHRTSEQFSKACEEATDMLCQCALECRMPIEYNLAGLLTQLRGMDRGYPSAPFWDRARKWKNDVIIGVDAHSPDQLSDLILWDTGVRRVKQLGFHIVDQF